MEDDKLFELMTKMYGEMQEGFESVNNRIDSLKNEAKANTESIVKLETKIEHDVSFKVGALFDAREVTNDKLDAIDEKVDKVQFDVNNLTMKVAQSDNTIIELKRNLKSAK